MERHRRPVALTTVSAPSRAPFRLRRLSLAELLDETVRIYRRDFGVFAGLALCVTLPGVVMGLIAGSYRSVGYLTKFFQSMGSPDAMQAMAQTPPPQSDPVLGLLASLVRLIMVPLTLGVIVYAANEIIPGRALSRSWELVEGRWWRTLGIFLVVLLMAGIASAILGATAGAVVGLVPGLGDDLRAALITVTSSVVGALVLPINYIAITLMYYDLRVRREGFDLDQLAQQAQPPSAA